MCIQHIIHIQKHINDVFDTSEYRSLSFEYSEFNNFAKILFVKILAKFKQKYFFVSDSLHKISNKMPYFVVYKNNLSKFPEDVFIYNTQRCFSFYT
jgi:hypothetical protein